MEIGCVASNFNNLCFCSAFRPHNPPLPGPPSGVGDCRAQSHELDHRTFYHAGLDDHLFGDHVSSKLALQADSLEEPDAGKVDYHAAFVRDFRVKYAAKREKVRHEGARNIYQILPIKNYLNHVVLFAAE